MLPVNRRSRNNYWKVVPLLLWLAVSCLHGAEQQIILRLRNGDRLTGRVESESTNAVTVAHPILGRVIVPLTEIAQREPAIVPALPTGVTGAPAEQTQPKAPPVPAGVVVTAGGPATTTNSPTGLKWPLFSTTQQQQAAPKPAKAPGPKLWNSEFQFGLNLRYSQRDQQEMLVLAKSTYNKAPWRHIFDYTFNYGKTEGLVTGNRMSGSEKTEYDLTKKVYLFNLAGAGYDEVRKIDLQYEINPGVGFQIINSTNWNFVMKGEIGGGFQRQYRSLGGDETYYSARIADIFSWKVPGTKIVADGKIEVFPSINDFGEYRLRMEGTLRYPLSDRLSFNLVFIDIYDTQAPSTVDRNDMQIRSTLGLRF